MENTTKSYLSNPGVVLLLLGIVIVGIYGVIANNSSKRHTAVFEFCREFGPANIQTIASLNADGCEYKGTLWNNGINCVNVLYSCPNGYPEASNR